MNICDELAETIKESTKLKEDILSLLLNYNKEKDKEKLLEIFMIDDIIKQKLERILYHICLMEEKNYAVYGFAKPAKSIDENELTQEELDLIIGLKENHLQEGDGEIKILKN